MAIQVTRVARALGALVTGVDLSRELSESEVHRLGELLVEHQVLFFRDQPITPQAQARFAARFGSLHVHPFTCAACFGWQSQARHPSRPGGRLHPRDP